MRINRLRSCFFSVCFAILSYSNSVYGQDTSFVGIWKLNNKQQIAGTIYLNAIPNLIIVKQLDDKLFIETKSSDLGGKEQISKDTVSLDGSPVERITASNRKKETRVEQLKHGISFTKTSSFSLPGLPDKIDFTRKESWTLQPDKKDLIIIKEHSSAVDSIDKWKVRGEYERTSWEELAMNKITGKGIRFEQGVMWEDLLKKAKAENKMIFVDCYATWCGPCKAMDLNVYPVDRVGEFMKSQFISLKLQMDTGKADNEAVKLLYPLAKKFAKEYNVFALPTLLFFTSDGVILHKEIGGMKVNEFLATVTDAHEPTKQLYTQIDRLRKGKIDYRELPQLSKDLKRLKEKVPNAYIQSYFEGLNETDLLKKESLQFAIDFVGAIRSTDKIFKFCYGKPVDINKIMGRDIAEGVVYTVIYNEEIAPQIQHAKKINSPNWAKIKNAICKKYNCDYANVLLSRTEMGWYKQKKDWKNYTRSLVKYMEVKGFKSSNGWFILNENAMEIVAYSNDAKEMQYALKWVDKAIQLMEKNENDKKLLPGVLDTKAALLYKIGNVKEAISIYEGIVQLNPKDNVILTKLKSGENPWTNDYIVK